MKQEKKYGVNPLIAKASELLFSRCNDTAVSHRFDVCIGWIDGTASKAACRFRPEPRQLKKEIESLIEQVQPAPSVSPTAPVLADLPSAQRCGGCAIGALGGLGPARLPSGARCRPLAVVGRC